MENHHSNERRRLAPGNSNLPLTPHCLRHFFITYSQRVGNDLKMVMEWAGHQNPETTMIYTHPDAANGVSPLDCMTTRPKITVQPLETKRIEFQINQ